jgi:DNA-binding NtrC family response regulator
LPFGPIKIEGAFSEIPEKLFMESSQRQLVLNKGGQQYIFRYAGGNEASLLDALVAAATDEKTDFDWFDAAVLSFKLSQSLMGQADELLYRDLPDPMRCRGHRSADTERSLADLEADHIRSVLAIAKGNKTRAAEILGINRKTLRQKLKPRGRAPA